MSKKQFLIPCLMFLLVSILFPSVILGRQDAGVKEEVVVALEQIAFKITDSKGRWITGLKKEDVELILNAQKQEILYLDELEMGESPQNKDEHFFPPFYNSVIIVLDSSGARPQTLAKHKEHLLKLLQSFPAEGTYYSIVSITASGQFNTLVDLTQDRNKAIAVITDLEKHLKGGAEEWELQLSRLLDTSRLVECRGLERNYEPCIEAAIMAMAQSARLYARVVQSKGSLSFSTLSRFLSNVAKLPGNKSVLVISPGIDPLAEQYVEMAKSAIDQTLQDYPLSPQIKQSALQQFDLGVGQKAGFSKQLKALSHLVGSSNITLYWVNASRPAQALEMGATPAPEGAGVAGTLSSQLTLKALSEESGGASYLSADLKNAYERLGQSLPMYYLVSFKPSSVSKSEITDATIRIQQGDREISLLRRPLSIAAGDQPVQAMHLQDKSGGLQMKAEINYFQRKENEYHVLINVGIPYQVLSPDVKGGKAKGQIALNFQVKDQTGKEVFHSAPRVPLDAPAEEFASLQQRNAFIEYIQRLNLRYGSYSFSLTAKEANNDVSSSADLQITLPGPSESCPKVSPIFLISNISPSEKTSVNPELTKSGEILYGNRLYQIATTRVFGPTGTLDGFYQVYGVKEPLLLTFKLYRGSTFVNQTDPRPITATGQNLISTHFSVPYKNLQKGEYIFEIVVTTGDSRCTASSQTGFEISDTT